MDQRLFAQLNQLQRGARETQRRRQDYGRHHATHTGYDEYDEYDRAPAHYGEEDVYGDENVYPHDVNDNITASYRDQRAGQSSRQVLPPQLDAQSYRFQVPQTQENPVARRFDLSQYSYGGNIGGTSSSSPYDQTLPSSPVANARQRRSAVADYRVRRPLAQPAHHSQPQHDDIDAFMAPNENGQDDEYDEPLPAQTSQRALPPPARARAYSAAAQGGPVVRGISLISTQRLPDRFRSIFAYPLFNAVQSKCFPVVYNTSDNFVVSAPTGSGKTVILELAICRLMNGFANGSYKIIYQAPTRSLCSERQRDWQHKFGQFDLQVAELTGDTDNAQLRNVQHASIIITTPEKWDSMTRKWKDHQKLMQMVKLFLIDEVHILKEDRGATLEAIVSRMKSVGSDIRFIALSATVPNSQDIATWLGKDSVTPYIPAPRERFGEEFRPVPLAKHVCGYIAAGNDFAFEKTLNAKLPDIITRWSQRKPIMVFCFTRSSCVETAKLLANWWATKGPKDRYWEAPRKRVVVEDKELRDTIPSGVAYHHAGLSIGDRNAIEKAYLEGDVNVICCTSTLAVGVNLPCHMVIIKNTIAYQHNGGSGGCKEYSDLEVMQMLGRAGRPQFDKSAVAVILTRLQKQPHYEKMVSAQEVLESCLHRNLIDHVNAEIGLGTITNASTAKRWLSGTFLYVRLKENPEHYKIHGDTTSRNLEERLEIICSKVISLLLEHDLVQDTPKLHCTEFGDAMARYYIQFETMKSLLALPPRAKTSEILSAIAQAAEFGDIRFRGGEKTTYKALNQNSSIKFPIPVNLDAPAHKISLVIQAVLGAIDFPSDDHKQRMDFFTAKSAIFANVHRLIRCIVDCQLYLRDSITARNSLALARSLGAQVWDDSPLHMKQLDGVGLVTVRKLATAGLKTVDDIEDTEQHRLELLLSRNPPFGMQLQEKAKAFPKLRVGMKTAGEPTTHTGEHVLVGVRADIGFMNEKTPEYFQKKPVYVCLIAELSDGHLLHFARISAKKLNRGQEVMFGAKLTSASQTVRAYVMCDTIAGTMRSAILKPDVPPQAFPALKSTADDQQQPSKAPAKAAAIKSKTGSKRKFSNSGFDEFGDAAIDDADLALAEKGGFEDIDDFDDDLGPSNGNAKKKQKTCTNEDAAKEFEPRQLDNGKWACNHACKDKTACKHLCCREGVDKKPKAPKPRASKKDVTATDPKQTQLSMSVSKKDDIQTASQSTQSQTPGPATSRNLPKGPEFHNINTLHNNVKSNTRQVPLLSKASAPPQKSGSSAVLPNPNRPRRPFNEVAREAEQSAFFDDFGDFDDLSLNGDPALGQPSNRMSPLLRSGSDLFGVESRHLVDSIAHAQRDEPHLPLTSKSEHKDPEWESLFDFDAEVNLLEAGGQEVSNPRQPDRLRDPQSNLRHAGPLEDMTSDSAAFDLGCKQQARRSSPVPTHERAGLAPVAKTQSLAKGRSPDTSDGSMQSNDKNLLVAVEEKSACEATLPVETPVEERPASSDSATKLFIEELGADLFNYVG